MAHPTPMTWTDTFYVLFQTPMLPPEAKVSSQEGIAMNDMTPPQSAATSVRSCIYAPPRYTKRVSNIRTGPG